MKNIESSTLQTNQTTHNQSSTENIAAVTAASFFWDAVTYGITVGDSILVVASDGSTFRRIATIDTVNEEVTFDTFS